MNDACKFGAGTIWSATSIGKRLPHGSRDQNRHMPTSTKINDKHQQSESIRDVLPIFEKKRRGKYHPLDDCGEIPWCELGEHDHWQNDAQQFDGLDSPWASLVKMTNIHGKESRIYSPFFERKELREFVE
jgi:hypothetical protein